MSERDLETTAWRWAPPLAFAAAFLVLWATGTDEAWFHELNGWSAVTGPQVWAGITIFGDAGVPCGLINTYERALSHPQVVHSGWVQEMTLPNGVETKTFGSPIRFDLKTSKIRSMPPALDEHGAAIRAEFAERTG